MTDTPIRAAIWLRVSTTDQDTENQRPVLEAWARARGFDVGPTYTCEASAWTGRHRAKLDEALDDARRGRFDVILVWSLDRLSREGIEQTLATLRRFHERGVRVLSHEESWTDGPPEMAQLLGAIMAWVAQMESKRRSERVKAGLARRRAEGKPVGRQPGASDKAPRKRSGYVQRWERERAAAQVSG